MSYSITEKHELDCRPIEKDADKKLPISLVEGIPGVFYLTNKQITEITTGNKYQTTIMISRSTEDILP
jgi:hypothetical protein